MITTAGEKGVIDNLQRKADAADRMFTNLVSEMRRDLHIERGTIFEKPEVIPQWL
jgi:hypothetical protein